MGDIRPSRTLPTDYPEIGNAQLDNPITAPSFNLWLMRVRSARFGFIRKRYLI